MQLLLTLLLITQLSGIPVMSLNIRYDNPKDGPDNWHERKDDMVKMLQHYQPALLGIQEGLEHQVNYLDDSLKDYSYIGVGRDDGKTKGEYCAIFYDSTRFELLEEGTFWLSTSPEEVSVGWDASMERICTYGRFEDQSSQKRIWVFNAHFDHKGEKARQKSAKLILKKMATLNKAKEPVLLMGDFNSLPESKAIQHILQTYSDGAVNGLYGPKGTFNGFDPNYVVENRIDYIFHSGLEVERYAHIDDRRPNNLCISDHLPILAYVNY